MKEYVLNCKSTVKASNELTRKAVDILSERIDDSDVLYELKLLLSEACSNVVLHSYPQEEAGKLEVRIRFFPGRHIEIVVINWGDVFEWPSLDSLDPVPEEESGRGIYIISKLADDFTYTRQGNQNILILRKNIEESLWKNCN